jgi:hypothetical protein
MSRKDQEMELLPRVERYLKASGVPPTRFGRDVARDPRLVFDMRRGRDPKRRMRDRLNAYLDAQERALRTGAVQ